MKELPSGLAMALILISQTSLTLAQDTPAPQANSVGSELAKAVRSALGSALHLSGKISKEESGGDAFTGIQVIGAGSGPDAYAGPIEISRDAKGEVCVISKGKLPGIAVLDDGAKRVVQTLSDGDPVGVEPSVSELLALLDPEALAKAVEAANWSEDTSAAGERGHRASLSLRILRAAHSEGPMGRFQARAKSLNAFLVRDAAGALSLMRFRVTRTDPMASIRRQAMDSASGGGAVTLNASDVDTSEEEDGATTVYEVKADGGSASIELTTTRDFLRTQLARSKN